MRRGEPRAPPGDPRAVSRLATARRRRRRRRKPQGLSNRGKQRADDSQRREQSHALSGRLGRRVAQALTHLHRRLQPWLRARLCVDRKSTRLNSSHLVISYAVFCLKKKKKINTRIVASLRGATRHRPCELCAP